jgi:preprotein translocase subunit SecE
VEPLPASGRIPPGPPRPPAPPTTDEFSRPSWRPPTPPRASWITVLRESWAQLRLVRWPESGMAVRVAALLLATIVVVMLLVGLADAALSSR